jgi:hypothetical protein
MSETQAREARKYEYPIGEEGIFQMEPDVDDQEKALISELMRLSARDLRRLLKERNIPAIGLTEKSEFVRAYLEYERSHEGRA